MRHFQMQVQMHLHLYPTLGPRYVIIGGCGNGKLTMGVDLEGMGGGDPTFQAWGDDQCNHPSTFLYRMSIGLRKFQI